MERLTRSQFLHDAFLVAASPCIKQIDRLISFLSIPETLNLARLDPNPHATLTNLSIIPNSLYSHQNTEIIYFPINLDPMYNPRLPNHLNLDPRKGGNLWGYGEGIRRAIKRDQPTFLVLEFPKANPTSQDWNKYVKAIAEYYPASHFVLGNEINTQDYWKNHPDQFAKVYLTAANIIKTTSPNSQTLMYGEAYYEHGETLRLILSQIRKQNSSSQPLVDGLTFHYYDTATHLPQRTLLYQQIAEDYNLPNRFHLTELGKPETAILTPEAHSHIVMQNLSLALALNSQGKINTVCWHTALSVPDDNHHSLTFFDSHGKIHLKPAFNSFWKTAKLLHHDVTYQSKRASPLSRAKLVTTTLSLLSGITNPPKIKL